MTKEGILMMKRMHPSLVFILAAAICLLFSSCALGIPSRERLSYKEEGLRLIRQMDQMAESKEYTETYGMAEISSLVTEIGDGDYTAPKAVYQAVFSQPLYTTISGGMFQDISPEIGNILEKKFLASIPSMITAQTGTTMVAASSLLSIDEAFEAEGNIETSLLLFAFDNSYGAIVTYYPQENGLILASSYFIQADIFGDTNSASSLETFLEKVLINKEITITEIPTN